MHWVTSACTVYYVYVAYILVLQLNCVNYLLVYIYWLVIDSVLCTKDYMWCVCNCHIAVENIEFDQSQMRTHLLKW